MHGYDMHAGPPPPGQLGPPNMMAGPMSDQLGGGIPAGPHQGTHQGLGPDMGQHPDSTDSYVTYLESDSDSMQHDQASP